MFNLDQYIDLAQTSIAADSLHNLVIEGTLFNLDQYIDLAQTSIAADSLHNLVAPERLHNLNLLTTLYNPSPRDTSYNLIARGTLSKVLGIWQVANPYQ